MRTVTKFTVRDRTGSWTRTVTLPFHSEWEEIKAAADAVIPASVDDDVCISAKFCGRDHIWGQRSFRDGKLGPWW